MAISRRLPDWFGSRAHYLGSGGAAVGLVVSLFQHSGLWGTLVVGGLYGAGAVLGVTFSGEPSTTPPPPPPPPPPGELEAVLRQELAELEARVELAGWPEPDARTARALVDGVRARVGPSTAVELRPVVRATLPAALDGYERSCSWWRWEPQGPPPGPEFADRVRLVLEKLPQ